MPHLPLDKRLHPDFATPGKKPLGPVTLDHAGSMYLMADTRDISGKFNTTEVAPTFITRDVTANYGLSVKTPGLAGVRRVIPAGVQTAEMTVVVAQRVDGSTTSNRTTVSGRDVTAGTGFNFLVNASNDHQLQWISPTSTIITLSSSIAATVGEDQITIATLSGNGGELWVNGVSGGTNATAYAPCALTTYIFELNQGGSNFFDWHGAIYSIEFIPRVLSDGEIQEKFRDVYNSLKPTIPQYYFFPVAASGTKLLELPKKFHPDFATSSKPVGAVEIDRSNHLAKNITDYICPVGDAVAIDLPTSKKFTAYGSASVGPISGGMALDVSATNSAYENPNPTQNGTELTLFWHGVIKSTPAANDAIIVLTHSSNSGTFPYVVLALKFNSATSLVMQYNRGGTTYSKSVAFTPTLNTPYTFVVTFKSGEQVLYANGKQLTSDTGSGTPTYGSGYRFVVGEDYRLASRNSRTKAFSAGISSGVWTAAQARDFEQEPYQILKPQIPQYYFVPAAAGGIPYPRNAVLGHPFFGPFRGPIS